MNIMEEKSFRWLFYISAYKEFLNKDGEKKRILGFERKLKTWIYAFW